MLLQKRKSLLGEILCKREQKQAPKLSKVREILSRSRNSVSDIKSTFEYFKFFKIAEQIWQRNINSFRELVDQLSCECFTPNTIIYDTRLAKDKKCWFIASGEICISNVEENSASIDPVDSVTLGEFSMFGYEGCGEQDQWENYVAHATTNCVLFWISNTKLAKFLASDNVSEETFKRNFICSSLNIVSEGSFCKTLIKKFTVKLFPKTSTLYEEGSRLEHFMLIRRGSVQLSQSIIDPKGSVKIKIGIIGQGSFISEGRSLKEPETICECNVEAMTNLEVYMIQRSDLLKCFGEIAGLESQLNKITEQKCFLRDQLIENYLNNQAQELPETNSEMISPLFRKTSSGLRKKQQNTVNHQFVGPAKYNQMVANQQKVWLPLSAIKQKNQNRPKTRIRIEQINRILKEEKINKIMVKQLIHKRVRGIPDEDIKIELKPTIFTEKFSGQFDSEMFREIQNISYNDGHNQSKSKQKNRNSFYDVSRFASQQMIHLKTSIPESYSPLGNADTGLINELSKSVLDYKKNVHCLKPRPDKKQRTHRKSNCDFSKIIRQKMKGKVYYDYVNPPREKFQCELNGVGDVYVLKQSQTGRSLRRKIRLN